MKKIFASIALLLAFSGIASAQGIKLNWTQSVTPGVNGNIVLRAPCNGTVTGVTQTDKSIIGTCSSVGTFAVINTSNTAITTYTDISATATAPATGLVYEVAATCSTCSPTTSNPSNLVAVLTMPSGQPSPPTNVTITASATISNGIENITASWNDSVSSVDLAWMLFGNGKTLVIGIGSHPPVIYSGPTLTNALLVVCDDLSDPCNKFPITN